MRMLLELLCDWKMKNLNIMFHNSEIIDERINVEFKNLKKLEIIKMNIKKLRN
jgi:hypothetical protein